MKRMLSILLALSSAFWMSCTKDADFPPKQNFQVDAQVASDYLFEETAATLTYPFTSDKDWTLELADEAGKSWCHVTPTSGKGGVPASITITVDPNTSQDERRTRILIKTADGASSRFVTLAQYGVKPEGSIRILAIGNSFSDDAFEYLYQVLEQAGYTSIILGNLYIGGCTLATHADNFTNATPAYEYRVNVDGTWQTTKDFVSVEAIKSERWDYISMQQASGYSGIPDSFEPSLTTLIDGVKAIRPNAKLVWHMTWAYQQNSTHGDFPKYDSNQMTMYNAIVNTVKEKVLSKDVFQTVVPNGTVIQNLRTSFIGDNLTRDGYHLSFNIGRYAAALMWAKQLSGCDLSGITWTPSGFTYSEKQLEAIKEAVDNACEHPFEITESTVKDPGDQPSALEQILIAGGYDPSGYQALAFDLIHPGYYNSASDIPMTVQTNMKNFATTRVFDKSELPVGTIIVQKEGFQYRPEGWVAENARNSSRPGNVAQQIVEVSDDWWGSFNFRAFNIQKTGVGDLSPILDEVKESFGIFVPKYGKNPELEQIIKDAGYTPANYKLLSIELVHPGYYNSASDIPMTIQTNMKNFATTRIFEKAEFPDGTLIVQKSGFQYRPEGWTARDAKNAGSDRPGNTSEKVVVVNDAWWGSFNFRAFNIQKTGVGDLTDIMDEVKLAFGIYIPVK